MMLVDGEVDAWGGVSVLAWWVIGGGCGCVGVGRLVVLVAVGRSCDGLVGDGWMWRVGGQAETKRGDVVRVARTGVGGKGMWCIVLLTSRCWFCGVRLCVG